MLSQNQQAFFELLKAGLWEKEVRFSLLGDIDYAAVLYLAEEQSVIGLVTAGLDHVENVKVPQEWLMPFIGKTLQIEEQNKRFNTFIGSLVESMRKEDIYTLMVKGQGIAQCYERPLWRASGDVDFYLSNDNFERAKKYFRPLVESFDPDNEYTRHINMHYGEWVVEIHANQNCSLSRRINRVMDEIHNDLFYGGNVRSTIIGGVAVFLPSADNDILIVFTHYLNHFYMGGVGVRQICDWCRLIWKYRDSIDLGLLKRRLRQMRLMTEWKAFAAYAVEYLGMPSEAMPFYDKGKKWSRKAGRIKKFIIEVGNFGHNRDAAYNENQSRIVRKALAFRRRVGDLFRHSSIFPGDSIRFLFWITVNGVKATLHGE